MSYDWLDDSIDHEVERMISQIRVPKWMSKPNPPPGLSWIQHFAWANKHRLKQLEAIPGEEESRPCPASSQEAYGRPEAGQKP
jgi:hypothetical protein